MDLLRPVIRPYPWGTRTAIADLQGRAVPAPGPEAELWMGAHPSAPSGVGWTTLDEVIAAAPERALGVGCAGRFGGRLPFLLKVLSAEKALSIQVHPSRAQAQAGYAAENARGLAADDPARNYVDDWPKPELLYALTPFEVAAGLRTPSDAAALLRALEVDELAPLAAGLTDPSADPGAIPGPVPGPLSGPRSPRSWSGPTPARSSPRSRPPAAGWRRPTAPTRTLVPRSSGSPPIVRATSAWSRCC